jgi:hypothetical protein
LAIGCGWAEMLSLRMVEVELTMTGLRYLLVEITTGSREEFSPVSGVSLERVKAREHVLKELSNRASNVIIEPERVKHARAVSPVLHDPSVSQVRQMARQ